MVRAPRPDVVPPGWQLQLIDVLAHGDGGVEPAAHARGGAPHEGQNNLLYITYSVLQNYPCSWHQMRDDGSHTLFCINRISADTLMLSCRC